MSGYFESHLTVQAGSDHKSLQVWAASQDLKFTHIVLNRGAIPSQPMFTFHGDGTLADQLAKARGIAKQLQRLGGVVNRIKVEVGLNHPTVPESDGEMADLDETRYFEFHIKLLLDSDANLAVIERLAEQHAAHLSKNAFRERTDCRQERFLTQRSYRVGCSEAVRRFEVLKACLDSAGYEILEVEREFVVFDDNLEIDRGWLSEGESS